MLTIVPITVKGAHLFAGQASPASARPAGARGHVATGHESTCIPLNSSSAGSAPWRRSRDDRD